MKKLLPYITLLTISALTLSFAGCGHASEEASGTVPWGAPASFEGAGVGLPQMQQQE